MDYSRAEAAVYALYIEQATSFLTIAAATCVLYDHLITLDLEIDFVWQRKRAKVSFVQILFVLNRYLGIAFQLYTVYVRVRHVTGPISRKSCDLSFGNVVISYLAVVVTLSMHGVMIIRVSSMYHHNRRIKYILGSAFVFEIVAVFTLLTAGTQFMIEVRDPVSPLGIHLCSTKYFPFFTLFAWVPLAGFEILILVLSFRVAIQYHRLSVEILDYSPGIPQTKLTRLAFILLRDSIVFPSLYCTLCVINFIFGFTLSAEIASALNPIANFAPCILGPRLLLNLREAYYLPFVDECSVFVEHDLVFLCEENGVANVSE